MINQSTGDTIQDANDLRALGTTAVKLMREVVEHQEVRKTKKSNAARALEDAGFIRVVEDAFSCGFSEGVTLYSCMAGEEALDALDLRGKIW